MADVTIGGQVWSVTLPNFKKLKAAWRYIAAVQASTDPMDSVEAILGIVTVGSSVAVTVDELEEALTPAEMPGLRPFINDLMVEIGLAGEAGETDPLERRGEPFDGDFDAIICAILAGLGSADWDGVEDRWNLHRYGALMRHWSREGPPAYIAVAAYLGLPRSTSAAAHTIGGEDLMNLLRTFPGGDQGLP